MQEPRALVCPSVTRSWLVYSLRVAEVRFRDYGLKTIEVIDNGSGIAAEDYDSIGQYSSMFS